MADDITIEPLRPDDITATAAMAGRAYLTSPLPIAAFGDNLRKNQAGMRVMIEKLPGQTYVARERGKIIGMAKDVEWPNCQPAPLAMLGLLPFMVWNLGASTLNVLKWLPVWGKHDPKQAHWHFGPFAVEPERQGQGIGAKLMRHFCQRVDDAGAAAYLETDKPENVAMYEHFGFVVTGETPVLDVPNWFMWRAPRGESA